MNEYVAALRKHVAENPPNYGSDANSILEVLFTYYHECNNNGYRFRESCLHSLPGT